MTSEESAEVNLHSLFLSHVRVPSVKKRKHAIQEVLIPLLKETPAKSAEVVKEILIPLINITTDPKTQQLAVLLSSKCDVDVLLSELPAAAYRKNQYVLHSFFKVFGSALARKLRATKDVSSISQFVSKFADIAFMLYDNFKGFNFSSFATLHDASYDPLLEEIFANNGALLASFLQQVLAIKDPFKKVLVFQMLFEFTERYPKLLPLLKTAELFGQITKSFQETVIEMSSVPANKKRNINSYKGLKVFMNEQSEASLTEMLNTLVKGFKRSREHVAPILVQFIASLPSSSSSAFVSETSTQVLPLLPELFNSKDTNEREYAIDIVSNLTTLGSHESTIASLLKLLQEGGLGVSEKQSVFKAITSIKFKVTPSAVVSALCAILKSTVEAEAVKAAACDTLIELLKREVTEADKKSILEALDAAIFTSGKELVRTKALLVAGSLASSLGPLAEKISQLVVKSEQKPVDRTAAIYGLRALLLAAYRKSLNAKLVQLLINQESFEQRLHSHDDYLAFAEAASLLLSQPQFIGSQKKSEQLGINELIILGSVRALVHASTEQQRKDVITKLDTIPQAQRTAAFVNGFTPAVAFVQKYLQERPKPTKEDEETLKAFSKEEFLHKRALGAVMLRLLPKMPLGAEQDESFFAEVFPRVIFFANHPTVNTNNLLLQAYYNTHGKKNLEAIRDKIVPNIKNIILNLIQEVLFKAPEHDHSTLASVTGAISSLMRTFVRRDRRETEAQQNIKAKQAPKTISEQAQERQQKALADDMADVLSSVIQNLYNQLYEFTQEDVDVFLYAPTKEKPVFHNVDLELTKNPLFGQQPSEDLTSYELTIAEWNQVAKQETEMKQKNKSLDIPTIRKQLVTQLIQNKEAIVKSQIGEIVHDLTAVLQVLEKICYSVTKNSRKLLHQNVSLLVFPVSNVMTLEISEKLSYASYNAFHALCARLCSPDPFPSHITGLISLATFRLKQDSVYHGETREARGRILDVDDDIIFAEKVISAVRIATIGKTLDAESFSILLPFLQLILHRNILGLVGRSAQKISDKSLITAMSLFSSHVGIEQIRSGVIRPECCKILVEVLSTFPNLFKQAHNALLSMSHNLLPIDLDPILDGLMSRVSVRKSVIKALAQYPPLTPTFNSVGGESVDDSMYKPENPRLLPLLWYIQYDTEMDDEETQALAESLWKLYQKRNLAGVPAVQYSKQIQEALYPLLCSQEDNVRETAAAAFAGALEEQGESFDALRTLEQLYNTYRNDGEFARFGVASTLRFIAHLLTSKEDLESVFNFLNNEGLRDDEVKDTMVEAGLSIVNSQAEKQQDALLTIFQKILQENQQQEKPKQAPQPKPQTPAQPKGGKGAQGGKKNIVIVKQEDMRSPSTPAEPQRKFSKQSDDYVVGTVVVYMGTLARYFAAENEGKLLEVVNRLVETLKLPSATVQKSVSNAVAPLLAKFKNVGTEKQTTIVEPILDKVMTTLANDKSTFGEKKGMCYGLTGIVSGLGIGSIKNYQILATLGALFKKGAAALPESLAPFAGTTAAREAVMLAYGQLADSLGQLFEPYTVEIIPGVLEGINDAGNERVRNAAEDCAAILMRKMTGHGVRMILPGILSSTSYTNSKEIIILGDGKTKVASIQLLGAMAYCSPRQLSEYLPVVVKALYEAALSDTLPAVQQAAYKALERVGGAVHNPEIAQSMPHILNVLTQPSTKNIEELLDNLLHTRFLHSIDAASLALLIPIVLRGLKERHSEIKKKSATIVGSLSSLTTNPQDLFPYVDELLPLLQNCVVDPQPKVRQAAAKAVGVLAKSLGEQRLFKIIEWLQNNLEKNKENPVERSGAAQTLSEIIAAQGVGRLQELLPELLDNVSTGQPQHIRHGYLQVFIFLPALMRSKFEPFLLQTLPKILEGLSDDDEVIRETAFSSSKVMVEMFATSSINMLVPALQQGMQSVEWRIRQSSLMLLSDFLKRIYVEYEEKHPEIRKTKEEDKVFEGEEPQVQISLEVLEKILTKPVLDNILALVFILQNDAHTSIKLKAAELWNQVVFHTPRQLRQILRVLLDFLVALLATDSEDLRDQAARALGELVMKMGEKVIEEVIPILSEGLNPQSSRDVRHGVCIGLRELLQQSSEKHLLNHQKKLLEFVRSAVSDPDPGIQLTGAEIFDVMFKILGFKIINEMLSKLLKDLEKEASEKKTESSPTLAGLQQLIRVRGQHILNKLIPMIIGEEGDEKKDISELNARILSAVVEVGGTHLKYHVVRIATLLIKLVGGKIAEKKGEEIAQHIDALQKSLVNAPMDELNEILELVGDYLQSSIIPLRLGACQAAQAFFEGKQKQKEAQQQEQNTKKKGVSSEEEEQMEQEFKQKHVPNLLESLLRLLNDPVPEVVAKAHKAISAIIGPKATVLKADELTEYIGLVRETIRQLTEDEQSNKLITQLPGFNMPGGLDPLLQMFLHGLMNGQNAEIREQSAIGLGDLVELTSPKFITAAYVLKIAGPLIRVAGERYPWQVKSAVLKTMIMLLDKVPLNLKAFLPQLQLSFVKNLQESNIQVRNLAAQGLGKLVPLCGTRVDPLITDVHNALKTLIATKKQAIQFDAQVQGNLFSFLLGLEAIFAPTKNATNPLLSTLKPETIESLLQTLHQLLISACQTPYSFEQSANEIRVALAKSIAIIVKYIKSEQKLDELIEQDLLAENTKDDKLAHGRISIIASMIERSPEKLFAKEDTFSKVLSLLETTNSLNMQPPVKTAVIRAASNLLLCDPQYVPAQARQQIIKLVATGLSSADNQVRYETARTMKAVAKQTPVEQRDALIEWIKSLLASVKDRFVPVKLASERAMVALLAIRESRQAYETLAKLYVSKFLTEREEAKAFVEYCGKVLLKLSEEDSEDEQENE